MDNIPAGCRLLTTSEVGKLLRVDRRTVICWVRRGRLPAVTTPGGHLRIRQADIDALIGGQS